MRFFAAFESRGAINLTVGDRANTRDQHSRNFDHTGEIVNWAPPALPAAARAASGHATAAPPSSEMNAASWGFPLRSSRLSHLGAASVVHHSRFLRPQLRLAPPNWLRSAASERNVVDAQKRTHAMQQMALAGRHPLRPRRGCYLGAIPISASSSMAVSMARRLSESVSTPLSRLCAMNPRMAMDCIALSVMQTEP